jgi:hypothetical protein
VRGVGNHPIPTWGRLEWDDDLPIEREVGGRIDAFSEHDRCAKPARTGHHYCDVPQRPLGLAAFAAATTARAAYGCVVALVCPELSPNRDRVPDAQPRRTIEQDAGCHAGGVRWRLLLWSLVGRVSHSLAGAGVRPILQLRLLGTISTPMASGAHASTPLIKSARKEPTSLATGSSVRGPRVGVDAATCFVGSATVTLYVYEAPPLPHGLSGKIFDGRPLRFGANPILQGLPHRQFGALVLLAEREASALHFDHGQEAPKGYEVWEAEAY